MKTLLVLPAFLFFAACGEEEPHEHHHEFTNYSQCYNHRTDEEGYTPQDALDDCDGELEVEHADLAACEAYYAAEASDVPAAEAQSHCAALFP